MAIAVCKFGGTSLSDAGRFRRVFDIIEKSDDRKFIVLSAPGKRDPSDDKITDLFYRAHAAHAPEDRYIFSRICKRYTLIRDALGIAFDLERELDAIWESLHTSPDYAASRGEYLCAKLFAAYAGYRFIDAADFLHFLSCDEIDLPVSSQSLHALLGPDVGRIVIPGFYGVAPGGSIRTFTRGGSDISGAVVSLLVDADRYENWTDVDGVYSADPIAFPQAIHHRQVNIRQMYDIAGDGAQVLHPKSLEMLFGSSVRTIIKNSFAPDADGTCISEDFTQIVPCVTGRRGLYAEDALKPVYADGETLPLMPGSGTSPLAVVSIFSPDVERLHAVSTIYKPISIQYMHHNLKIIIPDADYTKAVRRIHDLIVS